MLRCFQRRSLGDAIDRWELFSWEEDKSEVRGERPGGIYGRERELRTGNEASRSPQDESLSI